MESLATTEQRPETTTEQCPETTFKGVDVVVRVHGVDIPDELVRCVVPGARTHHTHMHTNGHALSICTRRETHNLHSRTHKQGLAPVQTQAQAQALAQALVHTQTCIDTRTAQHTHTRTHARTHTHVQVRHCTMHGVDRDTAGFLCGVQRTSSRDRSLHTHISRNRARRARQGRATANTTRAYPQNSPICTTMPWSEAVLT